MDGLFKLVTDRINAAGNAIASVHLSVRLFPLYLRNRLTVDLEHLHVSRSWSQLAGVITKVMLIRQSDLDRAVFLV